MNKYFPHTDSDIQQMLGVAGMKSLDDLYADVPEAVRFRRDYNLPEAMSEVELRNYFRTIAEMTPALKCFAGAGWYDHYSPAVVQNLIQRSEFLTSYTPYQAEISQGTLHYIFEYQTMMARLTGMDISNASMYDGATATAEAAMMCVAAAKKANRVLIASTVDPKIVKVVKTYSHFHGIDLQLIPAKDGATDRDALKAQLAEGGVAGVIVQQPNYYGIVEDFSGMADEVHAQKGLLVVNSVAADLAVLRSPAEWGADIAVGEAQSLGIPVSFGGPGLGYLCATEKLMRKMPGRIVGLTRDNREQRAFVLTLQAREQHIRRQKATSNICSNQSLMALYVTIYMSLMGRQGLKDAAELSYGGAHYLAELMEQTGLFCQTYPDKPFFNEVCLTYKGRHGVAEVIDYCAANGYLAGVQVGEDKLLVAVTEQRTREEIEALVGIIKRFEEE
ncbi:MAG: aminomethyl-transferring glycine dehydrogenase subunit GcvPA [Bacteroidaceae bacterium]|nr:aminomethyl-transferring glycine dehydrogenase subunit GcvPA [Bacteroidaceae bacterium]